MNRIGLAFRSSLAPEKVREAYIAPLLAALKQSQAGIYSNYLRQIDPDSSEPTEHLLVFEVHDFKEGLRLLRVELEKLDLLEGVQFQNLTPSSPGY